MEGVVDHFCEQLRPKLSGTKWYSQPSTDDGLGGISFVPYAVGEGDCDMPFMISQLGQQVGKFHPNCVVSNRDVCFPTRIFLTDLVPTLAGNQHRFVGNADMLHMPWALTIQPIAILIVPMRKPP